MLILRDLCQHLDWGDPMFRGVCQHHEFGRLHQQRPKQLRPEEEKKVGKDTGATQAAEPHWSRSASRYPKRCRPLAQVSPPQQTATCSPRTGTCWLLLFKSKHWNSLRSMFGPNTTQHPRQRAADLYGPEPLHGFFKAGPAAAADGAEPLSHHAGRKLVALGHYRLLAWHLWVWVFSVIPVLITHSRSGTKASRSLAPGMLFAALRSEPRPCGQYYSWPAARRHRPCCPHPLLTRCGGFRGPASGPMSTPSRVSS